MFTFFFISDGKSCMILEKKAKEGGEEGEIKTRIDTLECPPPSPNAMPKRC